MSFHPETENYKYWKIEEDLKLERLMSEGKGYKEIGGLIGKKPQACQDRARRLGFKSKYIKRQYTYDVNFWKIPNELNSYWAGFSAADAYIYLRGNNKSSYALEIDKNDKNHLEKLKNSIQYSGNIEDYSQKDYNGNTVRLRINGQWHLDLKKNFNIESPKTYNLCPPINLPENLKWCYIVGYIDGDGTIFYNKVNQQLMINIVSSSKLILDWVLQQVISLNFIGLRNKAQTVRKLKHANCYSISFCGVKAIQLFDYLRQINVPKLDRKWKQPKVLELLEQKKQNFPNLKWTTPAILV